MWWPLRPFPTPRSAMKGRDRFPRRAGPAFSRGSLIGLACSRPFFILKAGVMKRSMLFILAMMAISVPLLAGTELIRNVARPLGQRDNQLSAIGLVVGLNGTGDSRNTVFTNQALANLLGTYGINDPASAIKTKNVAAVMVTA